MILRKCYDRHSIQVRLFMRRFRANEYDVSDSLGKGYSEAEARKSCIAASSQTFASIPSLYCQDTIHVSREVSSITVEGRQGKHN